MTTDGNIFVRTLYVGSRSQRLVGAAEGILKRLDYCTQETEKHHVVQKKNTFIYILATLTESDCTVVRLLQQKCDNATLIIFISTTTTTYCLLPRGVAQWPSG